MRMNCGLLKIATALRLKNPGTILLCLLQKKKHKYISKNENVLIRRYYIKTNSPQKGHRVLVRSDLGDVKPQSGAYPNVVFNGISVLSCQTRTDAPFFS